MARTMLHDEHDRGLAMGPLYHANALWLILLPMLYTGGSVVILPDFDAGAALAAIGAHGVTYTSGTPSMYKLLLSHPEFDGVTCAQSSCSNVALCRYPASCCG